MYSAVSILCGDVAVMGERTVSTGEPPRGKQHYCTSILDYYFKSACQLWCD